jgi:RimJ/RimL family protein N-acetyltransferase
VVKPYFPKTPDENRHMAEWAARIIKQDPFAPPYACLGFTDGQKMLCVVVAHDLRPPNVFASIAAASPRWCTRPALREIARWLFEGQGCTRVTGVLDPRNERARKFDEGVGFKLEGTLRRARPDGGKLLVYGLLREDFERFINGRRNVATLRTGTA